MTLKKENVKGVDFDLPVVLELVDDVYTVSVDGVIWLETEVQHHAVVEYHLLRDHVTEYMHYEKK